MRPAVLFICCITGLVVARKTDKDERPRQSSSISIKAVPFLASLLVPQGGQLRHRCSGCVLHDKFVITAASCLDEQDINQTKILVGTSNPNKGGALYDVEASILHPRYSKHTDDYNAALVKLRGRLVFGPKVGMAELGGKKVKAGDLVDVAGWGTNANAAAPSKLRQARISVLAQRECRGGFGRIIKPRVMCAGAAGAGNRDCVSDEGGPVFKNGTLLGVVTQYTGCGRLPGLYTRASALSGWVTDTIDDNLSYLDYLDDIERDDDAKNLL